MIIHESPTNSTHLTDLLTVLLNKLIFFYCPYTLVMRCGKVSGIKPIWFDSKIYQHNINIKISTFDPVLSTTISICLWNCTKNPPEHLNPYKPHQASTSNLIILRFAHMRSLNSLSKSHNTFCWMQLQTPRRDILAIELISACNPLILGAISGAILHIVHYFITL